jgi:hypothetical protein
MTAHGPMCCYPHGWEGNDKRFLRSLFIRWCKTSAQWRTLTPSFRHRQAWPEEHYMHRLLLRRRCPVHTDVRFFLGPEAVATVPVISHYILPRHRKLRLNSGTLKCLGRGQTMYRSHPPHISKPSHEALEATGTIKESDRSHSILPSSLHPQRARMPRSVSGLDLLDKSAHNPVQWTFIIVPSDRSWLHLQCLGITLAQNILQLELGEISELAGTIRVFGWSSFVASHFLTQIPLIQLRFVIFAVSPIKIQLPNE